MIARLVLTALALAALGACAPTLQPPGPFADDPQPPRLDLTAGTEDAAPVKGGVIVRDGVRLPLRRWGPDAPEIVVAALHGMNDYSNAFDAPARWWAARGVAVYAIDQRGFGETEHRGLWPGWERMRDDAADLVTALRARHPQARLYLLGLSMGGAVTMTAMVDGAAADGAILAAPAVWSRETMPWWQTAALWFAVRLFPSSTFTGGGLDIQPSDNIEMLRALSRDPLVIKGTRVDAMWGVTNLMDAAAEAAPEIDAPLLALYGEKDEIIPQNAADAAFRRFPEDAADRQEIRIYPGQYHMILRGLEAEAVWRDVLAWMRDQHPTAATNEAQARLGG